MPRRGTKVYRKGYSAIGASMTDDELEELRSFLGDPN
jgi:hypothetical protein